MTKTCLRVELRALTFFRHSTFGIRYFSSFLRIALDFPDTIIQSARMAKVTYYLEGDKSKEFHSKICKAPKDVKATGTVKTVDGKKVMTVDSIQLVEK